MTRRSSQATPVAVIGLGALFPDATDARSFWRNILAGRDSMTDVPSSHWLIDDYYDANPAKPDKTYARRGAFLPTVPFDAMAFGIPPNMVPSTDTSQLLALIVAKQVLDDAARGDFAKMDPERISVILGATGAQELMLEMTARLQRPVWAQSLRELGHDEKDVEAACARIEQMYVPFVESTFPGLLGNVIAGRIANRFNLGGTNCVTDAACASSLSALAMGLQELELGHSDVVIAGGVDTMNDISMFMCFSKTPALSPSGDCRPFSAEGDGTMLGEGLAMLALKRLDDAERDGDQIYAVIRGLGSSSDGRALSVYAPLPEGQAKALRRAYQSAGYGPETVELVEAHGTGTKAGDLAEFTALARVLDESGRTDRQWCALGSVKSQIGHTKGTAGAAGLAKAVLALQHKVLPPTIKVEKPNPQLNIETTGLYLNTQARPWIRDDGHPRRASVSSFGFGGSNFHVTLEEYSGTGRKAPRTWTSPTELFLLSASSAPELMASARKFAESTTEERLARRSRISQREFDAARPFRLAVVATDAADLKKKLEQAAARLEKNPTDSYTSPTGVFIGTGARQGELAFLFPGQGSQYVGMGADLAMAFDEARSAWDSAASLPLATDARLHEVVFPRPVFDDAARDAQTKRLTATEWAQPAIGTASLALMGVLKQLGIEPALFGGHSYGELTALHAAGVFDSATLLRIARKRGELMRDASATPGAMTAVSAPVDQVVSILSAAGVEVGVANDNSPKQVVLSGEVDAIERAEKALKDRQVRTQRLPVATAFHSPVVAPARAPFLEFLSGEAFAAPKRPVLSNVSAAAHSADGQAIRTQLADQIVSRVRFTEMIESMYAAGARTFVEVGPGNVLSNLVEQILGSRPATVINLDRKGQHGVTALWNGLGRLAAAGYALNLSALWEPYAEERPPDPAPKFAIPINGTNYGRPYPARKSQPMVVEKRAPALPTSAPQSPAPKPQPAYANGVPAKTVVTPAPMPTPKAPMPAANNSLVEAHAAFQRSLSDGHQSFLRAMESSFQALCAATTNGAVTAPQPSVQPQLTVAANERGQSYSALPESGGLNKFAQFHPAHLESFDKLRINVVEGPEDRGNPVRPSTSGAKGPAPYAQDERSRTGQIYSDQPAPIATAWDPTKTLIEIVADKTGYPVEMLNPSMSLEGDLGVDSIKRVEILSALKERVPQLPVIKPADVQTLKTLGEIANWLSKQLPAVAAEAAPAKIAAPSALATAPRQSAEKLLIEVVADKTGYPVEMLNPGMTLEGDLGVDSIKRVEILSALKDRLPELPVIKPADVANLRTVGEIAKYLETLLPGSVPAAAPIPAATPTADIASALMEIVAEKTGYPVEMLQPSMSLEGDLGVDSIKRVEILSGLRDRLPDLPVLKPADMTGMKTLGQIMDYLRALRAPSAAPIPPSAPLAPAHVERSKPAERHAEVNHKPALSRAVVVEIGSPPTGKSIFIHRRDARVFVTDDGTGVCVPLVNRLRDEGMAAERAEVIPSDADAVIFLGGLSAVADREAALAVSRSAFHTARTVAARFAHDGGVFVTVQDTGGNFGIHGAGDRAWLAGLAGLTKTAAQEWPKAETKAIDIDRAGRPAEEIAEAIAQELLHGGSDAETGLHADGTRTTLISIPSATTAHPLPVRPNAVVVVSGGARGVTVGTLAALAAEVPLRIAILGRTPLENDPSSVRGVSGDAAIKKALLAEANRSGSPLSPAELTKQADRIAAAREARTSIAALTEAGAEVRYIVADVRDAAAVSAAVAEVRNSWGAISGVIHAAGVLADKPIAEKSDEQFDRVFDTKVRGLAALLDATRDDALDFLCVFSSVAARAGNPGQADYALSNEVLNRVAAAERVRRGGGFVVRSLGWGPWEGGMVTPGLRAHFESRGVPLIPLAAGAQALVNELKTGAAGHVEVLIGGTLERRDRAEPGPLDRSYLVTPTAMPFLESHRVHGKVVLPAVVVLEWFKRTAGELFPHLSVVACEDLRVLKGIVLDIGDAGKTVHVHCTGIDRDGAEKLLSFVLLGDTGARHYTVRIRMGDARRVLETPAALQVPDEIPHEEGRATRAYSEALFHGPHFQALRALGRSSKEGMVGTLSGARSLGWAEGAYATDPALLDGGLQLALLWGHERLGQRTLPTRIGEIRIYQPGFIDGPVRTILRADGHDPLHTRSSLAWIDGAGRTIATMDGVEMHVIADEGPRREQA